MSRNDNRPARIVLSTFGSHGDVLPFIAIGTDLAVRGHAVSMATSQSFEPHVVKAGLGFHPLCGADVMDALHADPRLWHPTKGLRLMFGLAVTLARPDLSIVRRERARADAEGRPFVTVAGPLNFGARLARDSECFPSITVYLAPVLMRSRHAPPELPGIDLPSWLPGPVTHTLQRIIEHTIVDPARLPALNAIRRELGLHAIDNLSDWLPSPDRLLLMAPPWFAPPQPDWPRQTTQVDFPRTGSPGDTDQIDPDLQAFLNSGPDPIVITYGSSMQHGRHFFEAAARACAEAGQRAVLVCPQPNRIAATHRPDQITTRYAPFTALFRRARAIIHHGGIGTCSESFAAGIPQIVVPNGFDQGDNAARVARLGLGVRLDLKDLARTGAAAVRRIVSNPTMAQACARARALHAGTSGISDACDVIEAAAGSRNRVRRDRTSRPPVDAL